MCPHEMPTLLTDFGLLSLENDNQTYMCNVYKPCKFNVYKPPSLLSLVKTKKGNQHGSQI